MQCDGWCADSLPKKRKKVRKASAAQGKLPSFVEEWHVLACVSRVLKSPPLQPRGMAEH